MKRKSKKAASDRCKAAAVCYMLSGLKRCEQNRLLEYFVSNLPVEELSKLADEMYCVLSEQTGMDDQKRANWMALFSTEWRKLTGDSACCTACTMLSQDK